MTASGRVEHVFPKYILHSGSLGTLFLRLRRESDLSLSLPSWVLYQVTYYRSDPPNCFKSHTPYIFQRKAVGARFRKSLGAWNAKGEKHLPAALSQACKSQEISLI